MWTPQGVGCPAARCLLLPFLDSELLRSLWVLGPEQGGGSRAWRSCSTLALELPVVLPPGSRVPLTQPLSWGEDGFTPRLGVRTRVSFSVTNRHDQGGREGPAPGRRQSSFSSTKGFAGQPCRVGSRGPKLMLHSCKFAFYLPQIHRHKALSKRKEGLCGRTQSRLPPSATYKRRPPGRSLWVAPC